MDARRDNKPFPEMVAERLIEQLKAGTAPWQKPWDATDAMWELPLNPVTGKRYKGINALHLMSQGRDDPRWMTYKQATAAGGQVRGGEKGTSIQFWKFTEEQPLTDSGGNVIMNARGKPLTETVKLERPRVFFATVFNAEQIDGLTAHAPRTAHDWDPVERAERLLQASGAAIEYSTQDRAFYRPRTDTVHLPDRSQFPSADNFYAVALHELGHWTGHASRLGRDLAHPFGSEGYAREELRAEIASMILGAELGIGHDPQQHAAYVDSWVRILQNDPLEIFRAAADAEKMQDYVLGLDQALTQEVSMESHDVGQAPAQPRAFVDAAGLLRDWDSGAELSADWEGVIQHEGAFWFAGHEGAERSFVRLDGRSYALAEQKGSRVGVLQADIVTVLAPNDGVGEPSASVARLEGAMRAAGMGVIGRVTGIRPDDFLATATDRLERIVDSVPGWNEGAAITIGELAQRFADHAARLVRNLSPEQALPADVSNDHRAETWTIKQLEQGTLQRAIDKASLGQLVRIDSVLAAMAPIDAANPFWERHAAPSDPAQLADSLERLRPLMTVRQFDLRVAAARCDMAIGRSFGLDRTADGVRFDREADAVLGFRLPHDWTGGVRVEGTVTVLSDQSGRVVPALSVGSEPENWSVYVQRPGGGYQWVAERATDAEARFLAERLSIIDAQSTLNEQDRAVKFLRVHEERVRFDPNSTDEDIAAARQAREHAEANVVTIDGTVQRHVDLLEREREERQASGSNADIVMLTVPFKEKDEVKALGAKWHRSARAWFVPADVDPAPFQKWMPGARPGGLDAPEVNKGRREQNTERVYLAVPYDDRVEAKAAGARWDKVGKSWYAGPHADMARLERWKPEHVRAEQAPAMSPREEFAEALKSVGCVISGDHPIMDGGHHRISVEGEKFSKNSGAGFYVAYLDGHPAGYVKNNKTGKELYWKSMGYALTPEEKAKLAAEAAAKMQSRETDRAARQELAAQRVVKQMDKLLPVVAPTPYLRRKGIDMAPGLLTDKANQKTYVPAYDADGKVWTMQTIDADSSKRFAKDSRKEGCFHVVGGLAALADAPSLVISEGYATAAKVRESVGFATVAAFDAGNLPAVAHALQRKYPDKPVLVAADDDRHLELTQGANPGRTKGREAAELVGGRMVLPAFGPGENNYPTDLEAVTPEKYREHKAYLDGRRDQPALSEAQLAALEKMKQFTDFNDLATRSALGKQALDQQLRAALNVTAKSKRAAHGLSPEPGDSVQPKRQRKAAKVI